MTRRIPEEHRKRLHNSLADTAEADLLAQVDARISPDDGMFKGNGMHYYSVGLSALRCIRQALEKAPRTIGTALDLPCGFGRVLRFLKASFPEALHYACDIQKEGVDFCASAFGATPVYSTAELDELTIAAEFDLIWCGSLVTHLPQAATAKLLRFFAGHLAPGGLVLFSTHGETAAHRLHDRDHGRRQGEVDQAIEAYHADRYAFLPQTRNEQYGISLTSPACIRSLLEQAPGLAEVSFAPRAWDDHHDVFTLTRE